MKYRIFSILLLIFIMPLFMGVSKQESKLKTIGCILGNKPSSLDPAFCNATDTGSYILHCFEGLTKVNRYGRTISGMAYKWQVSNNGKEYTFYLKKSFWTDGKQIKASDFEYAWKRVIDKSNSSINAQKMFFIKNAKLANQGLISIDKVGIKALSSFTLKVSLEYPVPYLTEIIRTPPFMPVRKDIVVKYGNDWVASEKTYIGNGAYRIKKLDPDKEIVLVKNKYHYNIYQLKPEEIQFKFAGDDVEALPMYYNDVAQFVDNLIPQSKLQMLYSKGLIKVNNYPALFYIAFNNNTKPFNDSRVRRAFSLAIDREYLTKYIMLGYQKPAMALVAPGIPGSNISGGNYRGDYRSQTEDLIDKKANIAVAKKLLAEAGYENAKNFPEVILSYNLNGNHRILIDSIIEQWKNNLGVKVKNNGVNMETYENKLADKSFQMAGLSFIADIPDPMAFLGKWLSYSLFNVSGWKNHVFDMLVEKAYVTFDIKARTTLLQNAEKILISQMGFCPIYYYVNLSLEKPGLNGVVKDISGFKYFHYAIRKN